MHLVQGEAAVVAGAAPGASAAPRLAAVALGSNRGDRRAHLVFAAAALGDLLTGARVSPFIETAPVGVPSSQPPYLNGAVVGGCRLSPAALLAALLRIERARGRERPYPGAARTLDLDLVLLGGVVVRGPGLHVPHPRFRERRFVLEPLAAVAPDLTDPVTGRTVRELLAALPPTPAADPPPPDRAGTSAATTETSPAPEPGRRGA